MKTNLQTSIEALERTLWRESETLQEGSTGIPCTAFKRVCNELAQRLPKMDHEGYCATFVGEPCNCNEDKTPSETQKMASMLRRIAFPNRGTKDEVASLQDFADEIQKAWTIDILEMLEGKNG
jgi:hypothetical protein